MICPRCSAPHDYLYDNNGGNGQFKCSVCSCTFITGEQHNKPIVFKCPHCENTLVAIKERSVFRIHKCVIKKCPYYQARKKQLADDLSEGDKYLHKVHYIYREFTVNFFDMDLHSLPQHSSSTFK